MPLQPRGTALAVTGLFFRPQECRLAIAAVVGQNGKTVVSTGTAVTRAFGSNVQLGSLIVVACWKYNTTTDIFIEADCAKSAGTATISSPLLHAVLQLNDSGEFVAVGIWTAIVTGAGSLTMQVGGAASGSYLVIATHEFTGSFDASREEDDATSSSASSGTSATSTDVVTAGAGLILGALVANSGDATSNITPDAAFTTIAEEEDGVNNSVGSAIYRIVAIGTTDAAQWTFDTAAGYAAVAVAIKEVAAGGSVLRKNSLMRLGVGR